MKEYNMITWSTTRIHFGERERDLKRVRPRQRTDDIVKSNIISIFTEFHEGIIYDYLVHHKNPF
jgi:hypothetical protein